MCIRDRFLLDKHPDYIEVVPTHWLEQEAPEPYVQTSASILLLFICVPANISQLLVFYAFHRYQIFRLSTKPTLNKTTPLLGLIQQNLFSQAL